MSTVGDIGAAIELGGTIAKWIAEIVARFVSGDSSDEVLRVMAILPEEMRADAEAQRQRELMRRELEEKLGKDDPS